MRSINVSCLSAGNVSADVRAGQARRKRQPDARVPKIDAQKQSLHCNSGADFADKVLDLLGLMPMANQNRSAVRTTMRLCTPSSAIFGRPD